MKAYEGARVVCDCVSENERGGSDTGQGQVLATYLLIAK